MESDVHAQLYRWFQARASAPAGQRTRAAVGALSAAQQERFQGELQGVIVAAAGGTTLPDAGAVAVMARAVVQYIEALVTLALDHAAASGGTDASEKHVVAVLVPHNEYQATRSSTLVRKYHRIRTMTSHEAVRVPVEGYHEGAVAGWGSLVKSWSTTFHGAHSSSVATGIRSASQLSAGPVRTALLEKEAFEARALAYVPPLLTPPGAFPPAAAAVGGGAAPPPLAPALAAVRPVPDAAAAAGAVVARGGVRGVTMHAAGVAGVASHGPPGVPGRPPT